MDFAFLTAGIRLSNLLIQLEKKDFLKVFVCDGLDVRRF